MIETTHIVSIATVSSVGVVTAAVLLFLAFAAG